MRSTPWFTHTLVYCLIQSLILELFSTVKLIFETVNFGLWHKFTWFFWLFKMYNTFLSSRCYQILQHEPKIIRIVDNIVIIRWWSFASRSSCRNFTADICGIAGNRGAGEATETTTRSQTWRRKKGLVPPCYAQRFSVISAYVSARYWVFLCVTGPNQPRKGNREQKMAIRSIGSVVCAEVRLAMNLCYLFGVPINLFSSSFSLLSSS